MNATDERDYIRNGFAELIATLEARLQPAPKQTVRANTAAREAAQNRVWNEYAHHGLIPPSDLALSITARLELGLAVIERPSHEDAA